jgi:hypothetical protein
MAWHKKGAVRKERTRDKVERGIRRVQTLRKRLQTREEVRIGIKDLGSRQPMYLNEEEDNHGRHRRVQLRTVITSGKWRNYKEDPI